MIKHTNSAEVGSETNRTHVDIDNRMLHTANELMSVSGVYLRLSCALSFLLHDPRP